MSCLEGKKVSDLYGPVIGFLLATGQCGLELNSDFRQIIKAVSDAGGGNLIVTSAVRADNPRSQHTARAALDFSSDTMEHRALVYWTFLRLDQMGWPGGLNIGMPTAGVHIHVDTGPKHRLVELTPPPVTSRVWPSSPSEDGRLSAFYLAGKQQYEPDIIAARNVNFRLPAAAVGAAWGYDDKNYIRPALYAAAGYILGGIASNIINTVRNDAVFQKIFGGNS